GPEPVAVRRINWRKLKRSSFSATAFWALRRLCDPLVPNAVATVGWFRDDDGQLCQLYFYDDASLPWSDYEAERFEKTKAAFCQGYQICQDQGVQLILVFIPMKFRVYSDYCTFPPESPCRDWRPWDLPSRFTEFCVQAHI